MTSRSIGFLIDTNIWLDYYLARGERHDIACDLIDAIEAFGANAFTAITTLKDVYYLISNELKRMSRAEGVDITDTVAASIQETAWGCVRNLLSIAPLVVGMGVGEAWRAISLKETAPDFEDALIISAAEKVHADYIVTADKILARRSPIPCLEARDAVDILRQSQPPCI